MNLSKITAITILCLIAVPSYACRPRAVIAEERVSNATDIYIGYVTGKRLNEYEASLLSNGNPETITIPESFEVRVVVDETLKGKETKIMTANTGGCGFNPNFRGKVIVVVDPSYRSNYVLNPEQYLKEFRAEIAKQSTNKESVIDAKNAQHN